MKYRINSVLPLDGARKSDLSDFFQYFMKFYLYKKSMTFILLSSLFELFINVHLSVYSYILFLTPTSRF